MHHDKADAEMLRFFILLWDSNPERAFCEKKTTLCGCFQQKGARSLSSSKCECEADMSLKVHHDKADAEMLRFFILLWDSNPERAFCEKKTTLCGCFSKKVREVCLRASVNAKQTRP